MRSIRVTVPRTLQRHVLESLHETHPSVTHKKAVARSYPWWSRLEKDIEDQAKACLACQEQKSSLAMVFLHPWIWSKAPWKRVHVDFAGPFLNKMFLVVIDVCSNGSEVIPMSSATAPKTIAVLQSLLAKYTHYPNNLFPTKSLNLHQKSLLTLRKQMQSRISIANPTPFLEWPCQTVCSDF